MTYQKKRPLIGYLNMTVSQNWGNLPWKGVVKAARSHDIDTISFIGESLNNRDPSLHQSNAVYDLHKGGFLDGLIFWSGHFTANLSEDEIISYVKQFKVPVVMLENYHPIDGIPSLLCANFDGMRLMMDHLVQCHGYKKIGFMGMDQGYFGFKLRYQAYVEALKAYGLKQDSRLIGSWVQWIPEYGGRSNNECLDHWLPVAMDAGLEAIVCLADPIAWWVIERLNHLGYSVPDDVAVVGFDGFEDSKLMNPPLTTVDPHFEASGFYAIDVILDLLKGEKVPPCTISPPNLSIGCTCGCFDQSAGNVNRGAEGHLSTRKSLRDELGAILPHEAPERLEALIDAFVQDSRNQSERSFLRILEKSITDDIEQGVDLGTSWQEAITSLNHFSFKNEDVLAKEALCQQARVVVNNASVRQQGFVRIRSIEQAITDTAVSSQFLDYFEMSKLLDLLVLNLPKIGIKRCYLALFDEPFTYQFPEELPQEARLVLAFDENHRLDLGPNGVVLPTYKIIPQQITTIKSSSNWLAFSLHFSEKQIGFVVVDGQAENGVTCEFLKTFISRSLHGIFLISRKAQAVENLAQVKSQLQTELKTAQTIQQSLLPRLEKHLVFDVDVFIKPALMMGSNFYDFVRKADNDWFIIGDILGQGIYAGLVMMMIQTSSHILIKNLPHISSYQLLKQINEEVKENINRLNVTRGMALRIFHHVGDGRFHSSGNGLPFFIYRHTSCEVEIIDNCDFLGYSALTESQAEMECSFVLKPGDVFFVFTPGLLKALKRNDKDFAMNHLMQLFQTSGHKTASNITRDIIEKIDEKDLNEDVTLLVVKWPLK